jgi:choline kinase
VSTESRWPTLLVMAAGLGSRYGGLKQLDHFGPNGETIMDYAVFDAVAAGFGKVVFIIRRDFEADFRAVVSGKYERRIAVDHVFQELGDLPAGHLAPADRTKPWGTAHAVWCARHVVHEPFACVNADDFYGRAAYETIARHLMRMVVAAESPEYGHLRDRRRWTSRTLVRAHERPARRRDRNLPG